jgi:hypothetical protein
MKVGELVELNSEFVPVVDIGWTKDDSIPSKLVNNYKLNSQLEKQVFLPVLECINSLGQDKTNNPKLIVGDYGSGKSLFLLLLSELLSKKGYVKEWLNKIPIDTYIELSTMLKELENRSFLVLSIDCTQFKNNEFGSMLIHKLKSFMRLNFPSENSYKTIFENATRQLDSLSQNIKVEFEKELGSYNIDIDKLKYKLFYEGDQYFLDIYNRVWQKLIGVNNIAGVDIPLVEYVSECVAISKSNGYDGLVIILDELGAYFNTLLENKVNINASLGSLQSLLQFCSSTKNKTTVIASAHESINSYSENINDEKRIKDYFQKVEERFEELDIRVDFNEYIEKIVLKNNDNIEILMGIFENEFKNVNNATIAYFDETLVKYYPFHPAVIEYLPHIVKRYGQSERTTFKFVCDLFEQYKNQNIIENDKINLIGLEQLFDYFFPKADRLGKEFYIAYTDSMEVAKLTNYGQSIVKILSILYISSTIQPDTNSNKIQYVFDKSMTLPRLSVLMQEDENVLLDSVKALLNSRYIFLNNDSYNFIPSSNVNPNDLQNEVNRISQTLDSKKLFLDYLAQIRTRLNILYEFIHAEPITRFYHCQIEYEEKFITEGLKSYAEKYTGRFTFLLPDNNKHYLFIDKIKEISNDKKRECFVVLNSYDINYEIYSTIFSIDILLQKDEIQNDNYSVVFLKQLKEERVKELNLEIYNTFNSKNYSFIYKGNTYNGNLVSLPNMCKTIEMEIFNGFPSLKVDILEDRSDVTTLEKLLINNSQCNDSSIRSNQRRLINDFALCLGLVKVEQLENGDKVYTIKEPTTEDPIKSLNIWNIIRENLVEETTKSGISNVYKKLKNEPFGLTDPIVELYLSVFLKLGKAILIKRYTNEPIRVIDNKIMKSVTDNQDFIYYVTLPTGITLDQWKNLCLDVKNAFNEKDSNIIGDPATFTFEKIKSFYINLFQPGFELLRSIQCVCEKIENINTSINHVLIDHNSLDEKYENAKTIIHALPNLQPFMKTVIENRDKLIYSKAWYDFYKLNDTKFFNEDIKTNLNNNVCYFEKLLQSKDYDSNNIVLISTSYARLFESLKNAFEIEHKSINSFKQNIFNEFEKLDLVQKYYRYKLNEIENIEVNEDLQSFITSVKTCTYSVDDSEINKASILCKSPFCRYAIGDLEKTQNLIKVTKKGLVTKIKVFVDDFESFMKTQNYFDVTPTKQIHNKFISSYHNKISKVKISQSIDKLRNVILSRESISKKDLYDILMEWYKNI